LRRKRKSACSGLERFRFSVHLVLTGPCQRIIRWPVEELAKLLISSAAFAGAPSGP
jgi:hypothetical protein